jgi:hypothetical protein
MKAGFSDDHHFTRVRHPDAGLLLASTDLLLRVISRR